MNIIFIYVRINFFSFLCCRTVVPHSLPSGLLECLSCTFKSLKAHFFSLGICILDKVFSIIIHRQWPSNVCIKHPILNSNITVCILGLYSRSKPTSSCQKQTKTIRIQFVLCPVLCTVNVSRTQYIQRSLLIFDCYHSQPFKHFSHVSPFTFITMTDYPKMLTILCLGPWTLIWYFTFSLCQRKLKFYFEIKNQLCYFIFYLSFMTLHASSNTTHNIMSITFCISYIGVSTKTTFIYPSCFNFAVYLLTSFVIAKIVD